MAFYRGPRIVTSGLVLALDAANPKSYAYGSTLWNDLSGNLNSGSLNNAPALNNDGFGSLVFDGSTNYASTANTITLTTATFISWVNLNGSQPSYTGIILSRIDDNTATGLGLSYGNTPTTNQLGYLWNGALNTYSWNSGLIVPTNTWCMVAISVSSTSATAYLCQSSGITSATNTVNHSSVSNKFDIGRDPYFLGGRFFRGNIAQSLLYNRALTATEIIQNYNAIGSRFQYPLANISTYLTLTQAAGLSIYDNTIENTTYLARYSSYASASAFALVNEPII
jgi:hypothetical protein